MEKFVKVAEAAKTLKTTVQVVNAWARAGKIPMKTGPDGRRLVVAKRPEGDAKAPRKAKASKPKPKSEPKAKRAQKPAPEKSEPAPAAVAEGKGDAEDPFLRRGPRSRPAWHSFVYGGKRS
jgi:hypothetical protein